MTDRISLRGLRFAGRVGVTREEQAARQPIEVDIDLHLDLSRAAASDALSDTPDYAVAYELARQVVEEHPYSLLEAAAGAIADAVLFRFAVDEVVVRVRKPKAPLPGAFDTVEVELRRQRDGAAD